VVRIGNESQGVGEQTTAAANPAKIQLGTILVLLLVYFLQVASPLRLHPDTVTLLSEGTTVERGGGFLFHGHPTVYPPGYPALVAFLVHFHLAHPWALVAINMIFLTIGLAAVYRIFDSDFAGGPPVFYVCLFSLLSFVFVKYSAIALTDTVYFGVSMSCLAVLKRTASSPFHLGRAMLGLALVLASVCVRRVGAAMIPAFLWALLFHPDLRSLVSRLPDRVKVAGTLAAAAVAAAVGWAVFAALTMRDFSGPLRGYTAIGAAEGILNFRLRELGELAFNLPYAVFGTVVERALPIVGALVAVLAVGGIASRRKRFGPVEAYVVSYVAILLVYAYYDPRYWLPVFPLLIAYCGMSLGRIAKSGIGRSALTCYLLAFGAVGMVTLTVNTALSYSGRKFADLYPEYHATYCAAWHCREGFDPAKVDQDALQVLRSFR
jgi:hypothetical protein